MKRYFLINKTDLDAGHHIGEYHYIDLGPNLIALVMIDHTKEPPDHWTQLPHILDQEETLGDKHVALKHLGATPDHTGFKTAKLLGTIHPKFRP